MREAEVVSELKRRLPAIIPARKIDWAHRVWAKDRQVDLAAELSFRDQVVRLHFELKGQLNLASLRNAIADSAGRGKALGKQISVLVAPHLSPDMRKLCRELGQAYLDLSGNAWIDRDSILIDKEVAKNLFPHQSKRRSPFADKATLVLRYLLEQKNQVGRVREIARAVGLSAGYVSTVVESAVESEFARIRSDGSVMLVHLHEMLMDWSAAYSWKKNECLSYFSALNGPDQIAEALAAALQGREQDYALTLHAGNNLVEPFASLGTAHLYVRDPQVVDHVVQALHLRSVARDAGNVVFMLPHYRTSAFHGARKLKGLNVVSDLQLYLDLRRFPVRGEEAAELIFERRLRPRWETAGD